MGCNRDVLANATGAASERLCRAGSYCGPQTSEPSVCPEGYICPEGSHSFNSSKQLWDDDRSKMIRVAYQTGTSCIWMDSINTPLTLPTAVHFPTIVQPTALLWCHVKGVPCLSTQVGSGDPKTAAVDCVRGAPIVHICPTSYNASHVHWVTFAPKVPQILPQDVLSIIL